MLKNGLFLLFCLTAGAGNAEGFFDEILGTGKAESEEGIQGKKEENIPIVQTFDIAGVSLQATYPYLKSYIFPKNEYTLIETKTAIPDFFKYNYNYFCRQQGAKTPEAIEGCIIGQAQKEKMEYIEQLKFKRFSTGEELEVFFTSPLSEHLVYKVLYRNDVDEIEGIGATYQYQQGEKRRLFWEKIVTKYGKPNIEGQAIWGDPQDESAPYLQAYYGKLKLEDPRLDEQDKAKIATAAQEKFKVKKYEF